MTVDFVDKCAESPEQLRWCHGQSVYTANVIAVKFTGFPCVPLEPCKVHVFITGKWVVC